MTLSTPHVLSSCRVIHRAFRHITLPADFKQLLDVSHEHFGCVWLPRSQVAPSVRPAAVSGETNRGVKSKLDQGLCEHCRGFVSTSPHATSRLPGVACPRPVRGLLATASDTPRLSSLRSPQLERHDSLTVPFAPPIPTSASETTSNRVEAEVAPSQSYFRRAKTKNLYGSSGVRSTTASCATRGGACSLSARSEWCDVATAGTHTYATREREARQFSTARVISGMGGNFPTTPVLRETIDTKPVVWVPDDERAPHR